MSLPEDYLWGLFDPNILIVIDRLRTNLGRPITVNNWKSKGPFSLRGYRPKDCKIGAKNSPHKIGKGLDFDVKGMTSAQVRDYLRVNQARYPEITRMEDKVNWNHIDCMPRKGWTGIRFFNP